MTNERDIPFLNTNLEPVGQIPNSQPMANRKQSGTLMKALKQVAKLGKLSETVHRKGKTATKKRRKGQGIEADSYVHFGSRKFY